MYPCCGLFCGIVCGISFVVLAQSCPERMRVSAAIRAVIPRPEGRGCAFRLRRDPSGELDFGVVLICLSKLAKELSLLDQTHFQSRSFRMKGQSSSFSTAPGLAETDVLYLERAPRGRAVSQCSLGPRGLCVGFVWPGSPESAPRRGPTLDLRCKSSRMNTCTKMGGYPHHVRGPAQSINNVQPHQQSIARLCPCK
jgi:hypothetical protein